MSITFIPLKLEAVGTSETSVYSNETRRCNIAEGSHLQTNVISIYIFSGINVSKLKKELIFENSINIYCK
jgi:hypothetical protein